MVMAIPFCAARAANATKKRPAAAERFILLHRFRKNRFLFPTCSKTDA